MSIHLLDMAVPLLTEASDTENTLLIKGFASTNLLDREGAFVEPTSFDVPTFMNTPVLLLNHKFIKDRFGTSQTAGRILEAVAVVISQENPENAQQWIIRSIHTDEFVSVWPKSKSPNLGPGDRGLFVSAEVHHPEVISRIKRGQLGGLSWRGYSFSQIVQGGVKELRAVDLVEISVVDTPSQNQSTYVVVSEEDLPEKEMSIKDFDVYKIEFDKDNYDLEYMKEYTKKLNIDTHSISETNESYFVELGDPSLVNTKGSFAIKIGDRNLIAAPKIEKKIFNVQHVGHINSKEVKEITMADLVDPSVGIEVIQKEVKASKVYLLDIESFMSQNPGAKITHQKSTLIEEVPVEIHTIEIPLEAVSELVVEPIVEPVKEPTQEIVVEPVVEPVVEQTKEELEAIKKAAKEAEVKEAEEAAKNATTLDELMSAISTLTDAVSFQTERQEKLEASFANTKTADAIKAEAVAEIEQKLEASKSLLKAQEDQNSKIEKQLEAFNSAIPSQTVREEKVVSQKSVQVNEPSFDNLYVKRGV